MHEDAYTVNVAISRFNIKFRIIAASRGKFLTFKKSTRNQLIHGQLSFLCFVILA
jgi:hypothetical protein